MGDERMESNIVFLRLTDEHDLQDEIKHKQDEFLDIYSLYKETGIPWIKEELLIKAYELRFLNPKFTFHI